MQVSVYSVSQINSYIGNLFSEDFLLKRVSIKGEVSNLTYHGSGHIYFTLKDEKSAISAVMFASSRAGLKFTMKDGDKIQATGSIELYEKTGRYQLYAREIKLDGEGDLYLRFEALKRELSEMGMFSDMYKKPIPKYAKRIGVVTAPTGAAVRDIIQISKRRNPFIEIILYPALVQGDGAKESIVSGIKYLDTLGLDTIIVGRGGGSIEDLWAFNEEDVARAIFDASTPIISAVGHETDTTIADFVSDLRAPTPSAAAELAVFSYMEFEKELMQYRARLTGAVCNKIDSVKINLLRYQDSLIHLSPESRLNFNRTKACELEVRLKNAMKFALNDSRHRLSMYAGALEGLSPLKRFEDGFAYALDENGKHISSVSEVNIDQKISVLLQDGVIDAVAVNVSEDKAWQ